MKYILRILVFPFFFTIPVLFGQVPSNQWLQLDKEKRNIHVNAILKDNQGYIWVATSEGLFQFDGYNFLTRKSAPSLQKQNVTAFACTKSGVLWWGCKDGTLGYVKADSLVALRTNGIVPKTRINTIYEDALHRIWFATNGEGIFVYDGTRLKTISSANGLTDDVVYTLTKDSSGNVYAGTDQGISVCTGSAAEIKITAFRDNAKLPDNIVRSLLWIHQRLMIGTQDLGIFIYDFSENKFVYDFTANCRNYGSWNKFLMADSILYGGTNQGLVKINLENRKGVRENTTGIASKINDLVLDNENNLWVACNEGLYKSSDEKFQFITRNGADNFTFIHTILADRKGRLWFTPDQGLRCLEVNDLGVPQVKSFTITPPEKLIDIVTLCEDPYGFIWIGTVGAGIFRLNPDDGVIRKITAVPALNSANILSIARNKKELWIAGFEGVYRCTFTDPNNFSFENFGKSTPLNNNYVYQVFPDSRGRIWFALDGQGLMVYDGKQILQYAEKNGLKSNVLYSITEDKKNNIWFSTHDAGLYRFDGKQFYNFSLEQGLSNLSISSLTCDREGNILAVNQTGVDIILNETHQVITIGAEYGISDINPDANSITTDPTGIIWIGTETGIIRYSPSAFARTVPLRCTLTQVTLFLSPFDTLSRHSFRYDENNFSFDYVALHYSNTGKVYYRYLLEGFSTSWNDTKERTVNYPKLPPGEYTFKVMASLSKDFSQASVASYRFVISEAFWKTGWFRLMFVACLAALLVAYVRQRERQLKSVERLQQEKIQFQFQTLKSQVNPHFLFNSFNTLISFIEENPKAAVDYVGHLSEFFRNIVTYREKDVIPLQEELRIIENYYFIQKKRYGESLVLKVDVGDALNKASCIPPLTLQILVENAIKHNAVSKETPLYISVVTDSKHLVIENNINLKMHTEPSSGMGLQNIRSRYRMLSDLPVEITSEKEYFRVKLPLLFT